MLELIKYLLSLDLVFTVIVGDFNFPGIVWPITASMPQSKMFLNFYQELFLTQHVLLPTRAVSNSILDLVLSSCDTIIKKISVNEEFGASNHRIVQFSIDVKPQRTAKKQRRNVGRADWDQFSAFFFARLFPPIMLM